MSMNRVLKGAAIAGVLAAMTAGTVMASGNKSPYERRNEVMGAIGGHMKALGAVAKGEAKADAATVVHAQGLRTLAVTVPAMFAEKAMGGKSRAKAEIWSDWDGFVKASDDFYNATGALVEAAQSGDAGKIGAALGGVGKTCGGCHKPFRGPKVE